MILEEQSLLPIVIFDKDHGWHTVQELCQRFLDVQGQQRLQAALTNNVASVAVEYHYIDKDYRDTFSHFHSKRFNTPDSRCVRLHFFNKQISGGDIVKPDDLQPFYLGYSVNQSPCVELKKNGGGTSKFKFSDIDSFISPLAEKIFLTAENFEKVVLALLQDPKVGIPNLSPVLTTANLVLRMYLTTVKSFKKKIASRGMGHPEVERLYRQVPLPHFIWVCELSTPSDFAAGNILGEIIWDATRNVWETEGWLAIHYPEILLVDVGSVLNNTQNLFTFNLTKGSKAYPMYRSNLKEV